MTKQSTFSDVNMTPLVDVMLVVLVLFMITSPLLLAGPDVALPTAPAALTPVTDANAVLTVTRDGRVFYRELDVTGHVTEALRADPALLEHGQLYIRGDRNVPYGLVAAAMGEARAASVRQLNLVIDPELLEQYESPSAREAP
jgi:biopolymer transport protein TolR